jgi:hypothetical protein
VSSATNFLITLLAARSLSVVEFGAFGLVFAIYIVLLGVIRAVSSQPLVVRYSTGPVGRWRAGSAEAAGVAAVGGVAFGAITAMVGFLVAGDVGDALVVLGLFLPGLLVQDVWRFALFAAARPAAAVVNDSVWGVALLIVLGLTATSGERSAAWFFGVWGVTGSFAALVGIAQVRVLPFPLAAVRWLRRHGDLAVPLAGEFMLQGGVEQIVISGVGLLAGLSAVAALRGADALFGPLNVLVGGLSLLAVPEGARLLERSTSAVFRLSLAVGVIAGSAAVLTGLLLIALPDSVGSSLLGDTWVSAAALIPAIMVARLASGLASGALSGLRALAAGRAIFMIRAKVAPLTVVLGVGGAMLTRNAWGAAIGIAVAQLVSAAVTWRTFVGVLASSPNAAANRGSAS